MGQQANDQVRPIAPFLYFVLEIIMIVSLKFQLRMPYKKKEVKLKKCGVECGVKMLSPNSLKIDQSLTKLAVKVATVL